MLEDKGEAPQADEEAIEVGKTYRLDTAPPTCCSYVTVTFIPSVLGGLCATMLSVHDNSASAVIACAQVPWQQDVFAIA